MLEKTKKITINIPLTIFEKLDKIRKEKGISVSWQLSKGAELYLKEKGGFK